MTDTGAIIIPELVRQGIQNLKDHSPLVAKRLSLQHIDILTAPLRDRIAELEAEHRELKIDVIWLFDFIVPDYERLRKSDSRIDQALAKRLDELRAICEEEA